MELRELRARKYFFIFVPLQRVCWVAFIIAPTLNPKPPNPLLHGRGATKFHEEERLQQDATEKPPENPRTSANPNLPKDPCSAQRVYNPRFP